LLGQKKVSIGLFCLLFLGLFIGAILVGFPRQMNNSIPAHNELMQSDINSLENSYDYLGTYSFTNDIVGAEPAGWTCFHPSGGSTNVISAFGGHSKVVHEYDNDASTSAYIRNDFNRVTGTIEFWVQMVSTDFGSVPIEESWGSWNLGVQWNAGMFQYYDGNFHDIMSYSINHWYHFRVQWDCTSKKWWLWIDGTQKDGGTGFNMRNVAVTSLTHIVFFCGSNPSVNTHQYIDAVDYSWSTGYYLNRNMDFESKPKDYFGLYSFTNDAVGTHPVGWTITEPASSAVSVVAEKAGHGKVLNLTRITADPTATQIFGSKSPSNGYNLEFWVYGKNGSRMDIDIQNTGFGSGSYIWMQFHFYEKKLYNIINGGSSSDLLSNSLMGETWYHVRIRPTGASSFQMWLNGIQLFPTDTFQHPSTYTRIVFQTAAMAGSFYVDAVDYSWASGYYLNRNTVPDTTPKDYLGTYSFTNDPNGLVPAGWTRPYHGPNTDGYILAEKAGHHNVIALYDNNPDTHGQGYTTLRTTFPAQTAGTIEFWFYGNKMGLACTHQFCLGGASGFIYLVMDTSKEELSYYDGIAWHTICNLTNEIWHHFRLQFDCTTDKFAVWVDSIQKASGCYIDGPATNITTLDLYTGGSSTGGFYVYFDAFDYSWSPGYYINRNKDYQITQSDNTLPLNRIMIILIIVGIIAVIVISALIYNKTRREPQLPGRREHTPSGRPSAPPSSQPMQRLEPFSHNPSLRSIPLTQRIPSEEPQGISSLPLRTIHPATSVIFCPKCGFENEPNELFCKNCGTEL